MEHLFRVPVAYLALIDHHGSVTTRIGSGAEHWRFLKTYPFDGLTDKPAVVKDAALGLPPGTGFGDLRFAASTPLRTSDGLELGVLVISDLQPRPAFSTEDLDALTELAEVLAGKMELRMVAAHALESELALREPRPAFAPSPTRLPS